MDKLLPVLRGLWSSAQFQGVFRLFVWLSSINTGFWILARVMSVFVDLFSDLFWEDVWDALATVYNVVLALLFSAVIFVSATKGAPARDVVWREMCGFLLLYITLGATYMDPRTHQLNDYARPGYALGLIGYLVFAALPSLVAHPGLAASVTLMKILSDSWIGMSLTALMVGGIVWSIVQRGVREMFYHLSPFLWFVGALEHPPIRLRRDG